MRRIGIVFGIIIVVIGTWYVSPVFLRGSILTTQEIQQVLITRADKNVDGSLTAREIRSELSKIIRDVILQKSSADINGDGSVNRQDISSTTSGFRAILLFECGNAVTEGGEQCDDGNDVNTDACTNACRTASCGDGFQQGSEQCDDGNQSNTDSCTNSCQAAACGDTFIQGSEACDDGNVTANDGCSVTCQIEISWFNADHPYDVNNDDFETSVDTSALSNFLNANGGSVVVNKSETPSLRFPDVNNSGTVDSTDMMQVSSYIGSQCGNSQIQSRSNEQCDDGNATSGDGCTNTCQIQSGYLCSGTPSSCYVIPVCGNGGMLESGEQCDDGNTANGDGCDDGCSIESGFGCSGTPSQCYLASCGDNVLQDTDECDDGNHSSGDGCSPSCKTEGAPSDLAAFTWTPAASIPIPAESGTIAEFATTVANGKLWVAGGVNNGVSDKVYSTTDVQTWTNVGTLPVGLYGGSLTSFGGALWFVGGTSCGSQDSCFSRASYYSTDGVTWTVGPSLPANEQFYKSPIFVLNSKLFIAANGTRRLYSLTSAADTWQAGAMLPSDSVHQTDIPVFLGKAWLLQGRTILSSTDGMTWMPTGTLRLPSRYPDNDSGRTAPSFFAHNGKLWVIGNAVDPVATFLNPNCFKTIQASTNGTSWAKVQSSPCTEQPTLTHRAASFLGSIFLLNETFSGGEVFSSGPR